MENYIPISFLNDFIFCPRSIYFHQLYGKSNTELYHKTPQIAGHIAHNTLDEKTYSTHKKFLMGYEIFCSKYNLCGKIDLFDIEKGILTERKREIKTLYDGYIFQVYAQYFGLKEMGYKVKEINFYDMIHNKKYPVKLPDENLEMMKKFEDTIQAINHFDLINSDFEANENKCKQCIYSNLCDYSLC